MTYNITPIIENTSYVQMIQFADTATSGWFGPFLLIGIWFIAVVTMLFSQGRLSTSVLVGSTLTCFFAVIFFWLQIINDLTFLITIIILGISFIGSFYSN